ncbi:MAG: endolytic transglycosylase MltG [Kineosporiaceae bacterium]|nr:endolytic transglycosylase MltG [Aeromicrobium sp.]
MTDSGLDLVTGGGSKRPHPGRRRATPARKRRLWLRRLLALLIVVVLVFGGYKAWGKASTYLNGPADYTGQGAGNVVFEVASGADGMAIANALKKAGVIKSAESFYQLSLKDARSQSIQPGFYKLRKQMSADFALRELSDKANRVEGKVTIPEGSRVGQIVSAIVKGSDLKQADLTAALKKPETLGLPAAANNNPEGYLYPATYTVEPGTTATELLQSMVAETLAVEKDLDIGTRAEALGLSSEEILTVASILEYEAKQDADYPKVARVLYNRIKAGMALQLDSTVAYVSQRKGDVFTTDAERNNQSAYNTYQHTGLPPGPIGSPGQKTIEAALNPADGSWLYFVAVNLDTGDTIFSDTFAEHNKAVAKLQEFCRSSESC